MSYRFRVSHTGNTWPGDELETAIAETAALGYDGFETFGWSLTRWAEERGGLGPVLEAHDLALSSCYCSVDALHPDKLAESIERAVEQARLSRALGGDVVVLGVGGVDRAHYAFVEHKADLIAGINAGGRALAEAGIICGFHPHAGTAVETEDEIRAIMDELNPAWVGFAPDTGHIAKGGGDALAVVSDYAELLRIVHLKDYAGHERRWGQDGKEIDPTGYTGFCPLGMGVVDLAGVLALLERIGFDGWAVEDLDGTPRAPRSPMEAARISRDYLVGLGCVFRER